MGGSDQPLEKGRSVDRVIPGESKGVVWKREGKIDPIKSRKVDLLRGERGRCPVWVVSHYERALAEERGHWWRRERTGDIRKRSRRREKPKERQERDRKNKEIHMKEVEDWNQPWTECDGMGWEWGQRTMREERN